MKRFLFCVGALFLIAGCGSSNSAPAKSPTPRPQPNIVARVGTIPVTSPVPVKRHAGVRARTTGTHPVTRLAPPRPLAIATSRPIPAAAFNAILYGTVTDATSHAPLAGAIVVAGIGSRSRVVKTDAFGRYSVKTAGGYFVSVNVKMTGYVGQLTAGRLAPGKRFQLNFRLQRENASKNTAPPPPSLFGSH